MIPPLNGVSKLYALILKGLIYLVMGFVFLYLQFEDLSFEDKVIEWPMAEFFEKRNLNAKCD